MSTEVNPDDSAVKLVDFMVLKTEIVMDRGRNSCLIHFLFVRENLQLKGYGSTLMKILL